MKLQVIYNEMNEGQKALINLSGVLQFLQMKKSFPAHVHGQSICFCPLQIIISMAILTCRYYCFPLLPFNELPCVPGVEGSGVLHEGFANRLHILSEVAKRSNLKKLFESL